MMGVARVVRRARPGRVPIGVRGLWTRLRGVRAIDGADRRRCKGDDITRAKLGSGDMRLPIVHVRGPGGRSVARPCY